MWGRACLQGHSAVRFEEDVDTWCVITDGKGLLGPLLDSVWKELQTGQDTHGLSPSVSLVP